MWETQLRSPASPRTEDRIWWVCISQALILCFSQTSVFRLLYYCTWSLHHQSTLSTHLQWGAPLPLAAQPKHSLPHSVAGISCWELALSSLYSQFLTHFPLRAWDSHIPPYIMAMYAEMSWKKKKKRLQCSSVCKGINFWLSNCCGRKNGKAIPHLPQRLIHLPPESK